jgi:hypothetical protein
LVGIAAARARADEEPNRAVGRIALAAFVAALVLAAGAQAAAPVYRTDEQAAAAVQTLRAWAGLKVAAERYKTAFCVNGYYSRTEQVRRAPHLPQNRVSRYGENLFASFSCSLVVGTRTFNLYVRPLPNGTWKVQADR